MRTTPRCCVDERGAVAVEFALVLPLLVMLVTGIIQFGLYYNAKLTLTHAVREGARAAVVGADPQGTVETASEGLELTDVDAPPCKVGDENVSVTASTDFDFSIPFVDLGAVAITSKAVMRCP